MSLNSSSSFSSFTDRVFARALTIAWKELAKYVTQSYRVLSRSVIKSFIYLEQIGYDLLVLFGSLMLGAAYILYSISLWNVSSDVNREGPYKGYLIPVDRGDRYIRLINLHFSSYRLVTL